jgi:hypothetical protein
VDECSGRCGKDSNSPNNRGNVLQGRDPGGQLLLLLQHTWEEQKEVSHHDDREPTHRSDTRDLGPYWKCVANLHKDHSLLSCSLEAQLEALIVKPLKMANSEANDVDFLCSLPKLIILDGLDECGDSSSHQSVLQVILAAANQYNLPFSFLIAS